LQKTSARCESRSESKLIDFESFESKRPKSLASILHGSLFDDLLMLRRCFLRRRGQSGATECRRHDGCVYGPDGIYTIYGRADQCVAIITVSLRCGKWNGRVDIPFLGPP